ADHGHDQGHAVIDVCGRIAALAQGLGDLAAFACGCVVAGVPALPGGEVGMFEDFVQHHTEARAAEARVDVDIGVGVVVGSVGGRGVGVRIGLVAAARGGLGGGAGQVVAGVGVGQLGEA